VLNLFSVSGAAGGDNSTGEISCGGAKALEVGSYVPGASLLFTERPASTTGVVLPPCQRRLIDVSQLDTVYWRRAPFPSVVASSPVIYSLDPPAAGSEGPIFGSSPWRIFSFQNAAGSKTFNLYNPTDFPAITTLNRTGFGVARIIRLRLLTTGVVAFGGDAVLSLFFDVGATVLHTWHIPEPGSTTVEFEVPGAVGMVLSVAGGAAMFAQADVGFA
jgi:hypothetical protein